VEGNVRNCPIVSGRSALASSTASSAQVRPAVTDHAAAHNAAASTSFPAPGALQLLCEFIDVDTQNEDRRSSERL